MIRTLLRIIEPQNGLLIEQFILVLIRFAVKSLALCAVLMVVYLGLSFFHFSELTTLRFVGALGLGLTVVIIWRSAVEVEDAEINRWFSEKTKSRLSAILEIHEGELKSVAGIEKRGAELRLVKMRLTRSKRLSVAAVGRERAGLIFTYAVAQRRIFLGLSAAEDPERHFKDASVAALKFLTKSICVATPSVVLETDRSYACLSCTILIASKCGSPETITIVNKRNLSCGLFWVESALAVIDYAQRGQIYLCAPSSWMLALNFRGAALGGQTGFLLHPPDDVVASCQEALHSTNLLSQLELMELKRNLTAYKGELLTHYSAVGSDYTIYWPNSNGKQ